MMNQLDLSRGSPSIHVINFIISSYLIYLISIRTFDVTWTKVLALDPNTPYIKCLHKQMHTHHNKEMHTTLIMCKHIKKTANMY